MASKSHDRFFRVMMSDMRVAKDFFKQHLDEPLLSVVDIDTLCLKSESFVEESLKAHFVDVLYTVELRNQEGLIYLLVEHQSKPEKFMPLRMLQYTVRIMSYHVEDLRSDYLPLVVPFVFYNGNRPYLNSNKIFDLFLHNEDFVKNIFYQPFKLINLAKMKDDEFSHPTWAHVFQYFMKHAYDENRLLALEKIAHVFPTIRQNENDKMMLALIEYLLHRMDLKDRHASKQKMLSVLYQTMGDSTMNLADALRYEGMEEGIQKGIQQGMQRGKQEGDKAARERIAQRLLRLGCDTDLVARATDLTEAEIAKLPALLSQ